MIWYYWQDTEFICRFLFKDLIDKKGLIANAGKGASLRVIPVVKTKSMKVITKAHWKQGDEDIQSITFEELALYLGVEIRPDGSIKLPKKTCIS